VNDLEAVRRLISHADPVAESEDLRLGTAEASALLEAVRQSSARPRRVPRRAVLTAGLAAAAATGAVVVLDPFRSSPAAAATPPLIPYSLPAGTPGAEELRRIADRTEALPAEPVTGEFRYVRYEGWFLNSAVSGGKTTSALDSSISETWYRPDGTGRERMAPGLSLVDRVGSRETLEAVTGEPSTSDRMMTHDMPDGITPTPLPDAQHLDTSGVRAFARAAIEGADLSIPSGPLLVQGIDELFRRQPVPPRTRAGVWRLLSAVPELIYRGEVTDRAARRGAAFTIDDNGDAHGLPEQYLLVIDPDTGRLLEYDDILTTDPGALNVRVPAVLELKIFLAEGYSTTTSTRP
jgi:hypothetical protein